MVEPTFDVRLTLAWTAQALRTDVVTGLTASQKWLPPKWFYDARGSQLFEQITRLPEYYPTRAERKILDDRAAEIAALTRASTLIELGSGSSEKTRLLLDALMQEHTLREFVPLDVSEPALREAASTIAIDYPPLRVRGVVADFTEQLTVPYGPRPKIIAFLGSTIGNLLPDERHKFLDRVRGRLVHGDWLLLGTDLVKNPATLLDAYNDSAGVTAEFNRNVLRVVNRELGADFPLDAFTHRAVWDERNEWIEMRLRADRALRVTVPAVDLKVSFQAGEELRTEVSAKFRHEGVRRELRASGFTLRRWWTDAPDRFAVSLAQAA